MRPPIVTVVIPAYNASAYISDCLASVASQRRQDAEVVVVDDGSADVTALMKSLQQSPIPVRALEQLHKGPSAARNLGISMARGDTIALLDADDVWLPGFLDYQLAFLKREQLDIAYCNSVYFGDEQLDGVKYMDLFPSLSPVTLERLVAGKCVINTSGVLARREVLLANPFDERLRCAEDFDVWIRCLLAGARIGFSTAVLFRRRSSAGQVSRDRLSMARGTVVALRKLLESPEAPASIQPVVLDRLAEQSAAALVLEGKAYLARGDYRGAVHSFSAAAEWRPSWKLHTIKAVLRVAPALARLGALSWGRILASRRPRRSAESDLA